MAKLTSHRKKPIKKMIIKSKKVISKLKNQPKIQKKIKKQPKKVVKSRKKQEPEAKDQNLSSSLLWIGINLEYDYILFNTKKVKSLILPKTYQTYLKLPKVSCSNLSDDDKKLIEILKKIQSPTSCYLPYLEKAKSGEPLNSLFIYLFKYISLEQFPIINNKLHIYNDQQNCISWLYDQKTGKVYVATIDYDKKQVPKASIIGECSKTLKEFVKRIQLDANIYFKITSQKKKLEKEEQNYFVDLLKQVKRETMKISPEEYLKAILK